MSSLYKKLVRPALFAFDPEAVHHFAMAALRLLPRLARRHDERLERTVFGLRFPNPIGLAAGFDKNAVALPAWETLGFGFAEAGTVTAQGQPGNPRPRIFRLPEQRALINRLGFNNDGAEAVAARLCALKNSGRWPRIPVGLNIGKTKSVSLEEAPEDYLFSLEKLFPYADYFALNVSSPNTPGLRALQGKEALEELLSAVQRRNGELSGPGARRPVLLKIAPDLEDTQLEEIVELVERHDLAGLIATNTTLDHSTVPPALEQQGGLSGRSLRARSTEVIRFITQRTRKPVIGVGGIMDAEGALEKMEAGATLVQLYTGFIYAGPRLVPDIAAALLPGLTPGMADRSNPG